MSTSLFAMTNTNFNDFIESLKLNKSNGEPLDEMDLLDKFTQHYTNFSGNLNRLYDVLEEAEQLSNEFSEEWSFSLYRLAKKVILDLVSTSDNVKLKDKWDYIMDSFADVQLDEMIYFFVDN